MAYSPILATETDPDAPLTSFLAKRWSDNWEAGFDGVANAPKLRLRALQRIGQSGNWLARDNTVRTISGSGSPVLNADYDFVQQGVPTFYVEYNITTATTVLSVNLVRSGVSTLLHQSVPGSTGGGFASFYIAVGVIQGDRVTFSMTYTSGASQAGAQMRNITILGTGELWPTNNTFGGLHSQYT